MLRRLYFLFPYVSQASRVVGELQDLGLDREHLHAVAREGVNLGDLPSAGHAQRRDLVRTVENAVWRGNLAVFAAAFAGLLAALAAGSAGWALVAAGVVVTSFVLGLLFTYVPNAHLSELREAIAHGEILLLVDVPLSRVKEVEDLVHKHHPEATVGGVGWTLDAFGM